MFSLLYLFNLIGGVLVLRQDSPEGRACQDSLHNLSYRAALTVNLTGLLPVGELMASPQASKAYKHCISFLEML